MLLKKEYICNACIINDNIDNILYIYISIILYGIQIYIYRLYIRYIDLWIFYSPSPFIYIYIYILVISCDLIGTFSYKIPQKKRGKKQSCKNINIMYILYIIFV